MKMFTVLENHNTADVPDLVPTTNFMKLTQLNGPFIQSLLIREASNRGLMCNPALGLCQNLRNGGIASTPKITSITNLSPFLLPPESSDNDSSSELLFRLNETAALGKLSEKDIMTLTKMEATLPYDYGTFLHMVKNMRFMCEYLGGTHCLAAKAWNTMAKHTKRNEPLYKEMAREHPTFYISVLDDLHRRFQTFIHSCAFGVFDDLKISHVKFDEVTRKIDNYEYNVRKPIWLPKPKRKEQELQPQQHSRPDPSGDTPTKRRKTTNPTRGDNIPNPNLDKRMTVPTHLPFGRVFHRLNRQKVDDVRHTDGSQKCNHFHHRGWCWSNCEFKASHSKALTEDEITAGAAQKDALIEKFKEWSERNAKTNQQQKQPGT